MFWTDDEGFAVLMYGKQTGATRAALNSLISSCSCSVWSTLSGSALIAVTLSFSADSTVKLRVVSNCLPAAVLARDTRSRKAASLKSTSKQDTKGRQPGSSEGVTADIISTLLLSAVISALERKIALVAKDAFPDVIALRNTDGPYVRAKCTSAGGKFLMMQEIAYRTYG